MVFRSLLTVASVTSISGHPTFHSGFDPEPYVSHGEVPPFQSYHVHVNYVQHSQVATKCAESLHEAFTARFNLAHAECQGGPLAPQSRLCLYPWSAEKGDNGGPFVSGNWAAFVPLEKYQEVVQWVAQHRQDCAISLDALFHPNSNNPLLDHMRWSTWAGRAWPLHHEALIHGNRTQGNEYCDHWGCQPLPALQQKHDLVV